MSVAPLATFWFPFILPLSPSLPILPVPLHIAFIKNAKLCDSQVSLDNAFYNTCSEWDRIYSIYGICVYNLYGLCMQRGAQLRLTLWRLFRNSEPRPVLGAISFFFDSIRFSFFLGDSDLFCSSFALGLRAKGHKIIYDAIKSSLLSFADLEPLGRERQRQLRFLLHFFYLRFIVCSLF